MKTKAIFSIIVFFFGFILSTYAQVVIRPVGSNERLKQNTITEKEDPKNQNDLTNSGAGGAYQLSDLGKESSVFFINDWTEGELLLQDQSIIEGRLYRYNMCSQQMQFIHNGDTVAIAVPEEVERLTFADHTFVYDSFQKDGKVQKGWLELMVDGECQLLAYHWIAYKYVEDTDDCGVRYSTERNFLKDAYFVKKGEKVAVLIPESKKRFLEMMSDKDVDLKTYMKNNKLKVCKEQDLEQLITYYNTH